VKFWKNFAAYAGVGYQFFENPNAFEDLAWTAGLSYYWKSLTSVTSPAGTVADSNPKNANRPVIEMSRS
jgi:hypothetical protein